MKKYALIFIMGVVLLASCKTQEEPLTPSEGMEMPYKVPQGNNEYDNRIVDWNKRTGTFILYKFTDRDAYWKKFNWDKIIYNAAGSIVGGTTLIQEAKPEYIDKLLTLVEDNYFKLFPDQFLKKALPIRILLCDTINYYSSSKFYLRNYHIGTDYICIGYAGAGFDANWTTANIKAMRDRLVPDIFSSLLNSKDIQIPEEFKSLSTYGVAVTNTNMFEKGFLYYSSTATTVTPEWDWSNYVKYISQYPYSMFTTPPSTPDRFPYLTGMLLPAKDKYGLVKQKYDIVVKYFKDVHGIDIQAIGNMP